MRRFRFDVNDTKNVELSVLNGSYSILYSSLWHGYVKALLAYAHMLMSSRFDSRQVKCICMAFYTIHIVQKQLVNAYNVLISPCLIVAFSRAV